MVIYKFTYVLEDILLVYFGEKDEKFIEISNRNLAVLWYFLPITKSKEKLPFVVCGFLHPLLFYFAEIPSFNYALVYVVSELI